MSDKWETVGKPAKVVVKGKGAAGNGKKAAAPKPMPKLEDVVSAGSMQAMYYAQEKVVTDAEKKAAVKPKNDSGKKPVKKDSPPPPKPKVPANLTEAVKMNVRLDDVKKVVDSCQKMFPDSPILWLRDVANYLNIKLVYEGSSELGIFEGAPLSALSNNVKKILFGIVQGLELSMKETYLETCISNTAHDMAKNLSTVGWKIMTQVLLDVTPSLVTSNLARLVELRNSYQNRPAICLAIFWSVGQAGKKDLGAGIRVWLDVMLPLLTMKHYTKFVVDYLVCILDQHTITADTVLAKPVMDLNNFITVQDTVFVVSGQLSKDYGKQLKAVYPRLQAAALAGAKNHEIFPVIMDKLKTVNTPDQILDCLEIMSKCLVATPAALVHWHRLYISHLAESGQLLQYLADNWSRFKVLGTGEFHDTIEAFQDYNATASHKEEVALCRDGCKAILANISKSGGSWFPWKTLSFLLLIGTAVIINLDVERNGTFKKSHLGLFLKDIGQYDRVIDVYGRSTQLYLDGTSWTEKNVPIYYDKARTVAGPALDSAMEYGKVAGAYVSVKGGEVYEVVKEKGGEVYLQLEGVAGELNLHLQGVVGEVKARYPGARDQAKVYLDLAVKGVKGGADHCVAFYQELVAGKVDWDEVKKNLLSKVQEGQASLLTAINAAKNHIQELVK